MSVRTRCLAEIVRLELARERRLPEGLFAGISPKIVKGRRDRALARWRPMSPTFQHDEDRIPVPGVVDMWRRNSVT
jgi:hypothetical protein